MKRKITLIVCVLIMTIALLTSGVSAAETYAPDEYGQYTVSLSYEPHNSYLLIVLKGEYDQTNYIEAFNGAGDGDIIYFEQQTSDENGNVTFGPFVPMGYYDATLILGGVGMDEPALAGYLSADDISNVESITISGLKNNYTVEGINGEDISVAVNAELKDSFGYPTATNESASFTLSDGADGVAIEDGVLTISKTAKAQTFSVTATCGEVTKTAFVTVSRNPSEHTYIEVYDSAESTTAVESVFVTGVTGSYPSVTLYAKTFDQYGAEIEDNYTYVFDGLTATNKVTPKRAGETVFTVKSGNSMLEKSIAVVAIARADYAGSALELYNLIEECKAEIALIGTEKFISSELGKDVFPDKSWTEKSDYNSFAAAVETAKTALEKYGTEGFGDNDYSDRVTTLTKALATYRSSFAAGKRVDVTSITFEETAIRIPKTSTPVEVAYVTVPNIKTTTDVITWTSSDEAVVKFNSDGDIIAYGKGVATVTATTRGGLKAELEVTVYQPANIQVTLTPSKLTATYGSETVSFTANAYPDTQNDTFTWTVAKPEIADIIISEDGLTATVVPKSAGTTNVTVVSDGGKKSATSSLTVKMPEWDTAQAPAADVESGRILKNTAVTLETATENAVIYYTLDGTTPSKTNGRVYKNPIVISKDLTLKAVAVGEGMFDSAVATYEYDVVAAAISAGKVTSKSGKEVSVDINYTDIINVSDFSYTITYDADVLTYKGVIPGDESFGDIGTNDNDAFNFNAAVPGKITVSISNADYSFEGTALTLVFDVKADAAEGEYAISFSDVSATMSGTVVDIAANDGYVMIHNFLIGDANDDGKVGLADVLIMKRYLAGKNDAVKSILLEAADCDADGDVDSDDVTLLSRYCVGLEETLG